MVQTGVLGLWLSWTIFINRRKGAQGLRQHGLLLDPNSTVVCSGSPLFMASGTKVSYSEVCFL